MSERKIRVTINGTGFAKRHGISAPFDNIACANCVHRQYAMESADAGDTSFPMPLRFHAHGYVNEMKDAVECVINRDRFPRSGALMAWSALPLTQELCHRNRGTGSSVYSLVSHELSVCFSMPAIGSPEQGQKPGKGNTEMLAQDVPSGDRYE